MRNVIPNQQHIEFEDCPLPDFDINKYFKIDRDVVKTTPSSWKMNEGAVVPDIDHDDIYINQYLTFDYHNIEKFC